MQSGIFQKPYGIVDRIKFAFFSKIDIKTFNQPPEKIRLGQGREAGDGRRASGDGRELSDHQGLDSDEEGAFPAGS